MLEHAKSRRCVQVVRAAICHVRGKAGCVTPSSDREHTWAHCPRAEQGWITHGCLHITLLGKIPGVSVCPWDGGVKETPF